MNVVNLQTHVSRMRANLATERAPFCMRTGRASRELPINIWNLFKVLLVCFSAASAAKQPIYSVHLAKWNLAKRACVEPVVVGVVVFRAATAATTTAATARTQQHRV